ncbi:MAG: ester cyclase [Chloroflexi bacterium]|nr:ester cyclase [Chloroflexota bacterium]
MTTSRQPTTGDKAKAVLRKLADTFNKKDIKGFESVYSPNLVYHGTGELARATRRDFVEFVSAMMAAFPDAKVTPDDLTVEGDRVTYRMTVTGTHRGAFMGIPPTNKTITIRTIGIARVSGDQIVEEWENFDEMGLLQQLGAIPKAA